MQQKFNIMLARFPYGGVERTELVDWCAAALAWSKRQSDIAEFRFWHVNDTPITMCRNRAVLAAIHNEADVLIMVDSDMSPDIDRSHPFIPSAFEFMKSRWHQAPTIIAVPYLTAGPDYLPTLGRWRTYRDGMDIKTDLYTREEAAQMTGIQPCSLMGTGVMAIDMRVFTGFQLGEQTVKLPPPWFYYEFTDEYRSTKASTEDMVFTRNACALFAGAGLEVGFADWDAWAYHVKTQFVGRPKSIELTDLAQMFRGVKPQEHEE